MARGINKVILIGNLGSDPEVRYTANGNAVANISIATSDSWKDKQTGEMQEQTEWHRVVFFNRLGEIAGEYLKKGSKVYVEGRIRTRKWQDNTGADRYSTEIIGQEMQMLDSKGGAGMVSSGHSTGTSAKKSAAGGQISQPPAPSQLEPAAGEFEDDIPF